MFSNLLRFPSIIVKVMTHIRLGAVISNCDILSLVWIQFLRAPRIIGVCLGPVTRQLAILIFPRLLLHFLSLSVWQRNAKTFFASSRLIWSLNAHRPLPILVPGCWFVRISLLLEQVAKDVIVVRLLFHYLLDCDQKVNGLILKLIFLSDVM